MWLKHYIVVVEINREMKFQCRLLVVDCHAQRAGLHHDTLARHAQVDGGNAVRRSQGQLHRGAVNGADSAQLSFLQDEKTEVRHGGRGVDRRLSLRIANLRGSFTLVIVPTIGQ